MKLKILKGTFGDSSAFGFKDGRGDGGAYGGLFAVDHGHGFGFGETYGFGACGGQGYGVGLTYGEDATLAKVGCLYAVSKENFQVET